MRCANVLGATWPPVVVIVVIVDALIFLDLVKAKVTALKNVVKNALKKGVFLATAIAFVINAFDN